MELIRSDLQKHSINLTVSEENNTLYLKSELESEIKFDEMLHCKELHVLSGAIKVLAKSSEFSVQKDGNLRKWPNLDQLRKDWDMRPDKFFTNDKPIFTNEITK